MAENSDNTKDKEKLLDAFEEKLDKILIKAEEKKSTELVDIFTAILLSLATIGSAWCAFQSTLWGGIQTFELAYSGKAGRIASENFIKAYQKRAFDATMVMKYIDASEEGNIKMQDFYFSKFDSTLKKNTVEWLKLDPFNNENAPNSPMRMQTYVLKEEIDAEIQSNLSAEKLASANEANTTSDKYVALTVFFAAALFFGGIAGTMNSIMVRNVCLIISSLIFLITLILLINMPVTAI